MSAFLRGFWQGYTLQVAPTWVRYAFAMGWSFAVGIPVGRWVA